MAIVQWVNLEKNSDYLNDPDIASLDRCGKLTIKTAFATDSVPLSYKVTVSDAPGADNVSYNAAELGRNPNFRMTQGATDISNSSEVLMEDSIQLPAAGGNKYQLEAKDANGKNATSVEVEAKRKLYYQFMHMEDATGKVTPYTLTQLEQHCLKNHIVLTKAGTDKKIPFQKNINTSRGQHSVFGQNITAQYDIKDALKRVGCVTALSNYVARFTEVEETIIHDIGGVIEPAFTLSPSALSLWVLDNSYLWYGLDDDDDKEINKEWFIEGALQFSPDPNDTTKKPYSVEIYKTDVTVGGPAYKTYGGRRYIDIKRVSGSDLDNLLKESKGTITAVITFNKINGFSGGFSFSHGGIAITTCCTKSWFEDKTPSNSDVIWNHELGHRMGMVAHGDSSLVENPNIEDEERKKNNLIFRKSRQQTLPNGPSTLYGENYGVNDKGHQGPHCSYGFSETAYDAASNKWTGAPGCVLFGSTSASDASGNHKSPLDYFPECTTIVRKLDLSF